MARAWEARVGAAVSRFIETLVSLIETCRRESSGALGLASGALTGDTVVKDFAWTG